jgi:hypothetical protein
LREDFVPFEICDYAPFVILKNNTIKVFSVRNKPINSKEIENWVREAGGEEMIDHWGIHKGIKRNDDSRIKQAFTGDDNFGCFTREDLINNKTENHPKLNLVFRHHTPKPNTYVVHELKRDYDVDNTEAWIKNYAHENGLENVPYYLLGCWTDPRDICFPDDSENIIRFGTHKELVDYTGNGWELKDVNVWCPSRYSLELFIRQADYEIDEINEKKNHYIELLEQYEVLYPETAKLSN